MSLPDEIISEILSPALKVPEYMFSNLSSQSPFAKYTVSSSAALLVCKAWLRVATPLLYHVVIIRSKAQARALCDALRQNKVLGRFIKKLRMEGGYGGPVQDILRNAPNITDLFISLQIHSSDSTSGLAAGLPLINPTRVIIFDEDKNLLRNKAVLQVLDSLEGCVKKWTNVHTLLFPYHTKVSPRESFVVAMCACSNLKILSFPPPDPLIVPLLIKIAQYPGLEAIEIRPISKQKKRSLPLSTDPRLGSLLRWAKDTPIKAPVRKYILTACPPTDPSFQPLATTPEDTAERIWSRILFFAMLALEPRPKTALQKQQQRLANSKRARFLLVSKTFHRLGLPYLYRYLSLQSHTSLRRLVTSLDAVPSLGEYIHELDFRNIFKIYDDPENLESAFRCMPRLERLVVDSRLSLDWESFCALAETAGGTLTELTGFVVNQEDPSALHSPAVLEHFNVLRSLSLKSAKRFAPVFFDATAAIPTASFPALEFLSVSSREVLPLLTQMDLPSLHRVALYMNIASPGTPSDEARFLRQHRDKIWSLRVDTVMIGAESVLDLCPNISILFCRVAPQDDYNLGARTGFQHAFLRKLVVTKYSGRTKTDDVNEWGDFFAALDVSHLPALCELRVPACEWPTTEYGIVKSLWVKAAENLLVRGIKLTNKTGVEWHPRLRASTSRR
ncbi:hypothetical protein DFH07DRAFT_921075 [Mycena maculata]|uniref:F-box domain-containing protein n=1 Tax=Mycena maculata TaxID=230809 RepID=A0AAD7J4E9_9AGAR|nr:hypothetical protein DFH07DRAFT_921075 [Mycena maculata]